MNVGLVQCMFDKKEHLKRLEAEPRPTFHVYEIENEMLKNLGMPLSKMTMYHQAHDHLPPADASGCPMVDGWIPFDFRWVDHYKS